MISISVFSIFQSCIEGSYNLTNQFSRIQQAQYGYATQKGCGQTAIFKSGEIVNFTVNATHDAVMVEQWLKGPNTGYVWEKVQTWMNVKAGTKRTRGAIAGAAGKKETYIRVYQSLSQYYDVYCDYYVPGSLVGALTIMSNAGAYGVYVNDNYKGMDEGDGIFIINLDPGNYKIELKKSGCENALGLASVVAETNTQVIINMICLSTPFPSTNPPTQTSTIIPTSYPTITQTPPGLLGGNIFIYAGIGIIIVLLIVLIVVLLTRKRPP
jgi:hypothetical protein